MNGEYCTHLAGAAIEHSDRVGQLDGLSLRRDENLRGLVNALRWQHCHVGVTLAVGAVAAHRHLEAVLALGQIRQRHCRAVLIHIACRLRRSFE